MITLRLKNTSSGLKKESLVTDMTCIDQNIPNSGSYPNARAN